MRLTSCSLLAWYVHRLHLYAVQRAQRALPGRQSALCRAALALVSASLVTLSAAPARAETRRERLRTGEAETAEPATEKPLKAALQNLFLQEDPFPQPLLAAQLGIRLALSEPESQLTLETEILAELGLGDSWTVSVSAPLTLLPREERTLANSGIGALYSFWVSTNENLRLSASVQNGFPSPASDGDHAFSHDVNLIGYARLAPLHLQVVAALNASHGSDVEGVSIGPEAAAAAIVKVGRFALALETALQRQLTRRQRVSSLGVFFYPGAFELGVAASADWSESPVTFGGLFLVSGQADLGP